MTYPDETGIHAAAQLLARWRDTPSCPMPRKQRLVLASASTPLKCDQPATVMTAVPVRNNATGELGTVTQKLCLDHSIEAAGWKLIYTLFAEARA